eukprot:TRINITY_DN1126_c0_g3_i1.p1 TRINITY_DN1126_c0_g3~~TRINITY_DN1126_c0_g3_i1.p1  ORF type:complete len:316 (+),score=80.08 TRINITY_DN1126_c0_g3_i1:86-1033(+)
MQSPTAVSRWLAEHGLKVYEPGLRSEGYDDLQDLAELVALPEDQWRHIVTAEGHRRKLRRLLCVACTPRLSEPAHSSSAAHSPPPQSDVSERTAISHTPTVPSARAPRHCPPRRRLKVLVVGDVNAGKTTLIERLVGGRFAETKATIGIDFRERTVHVGSDVVSLQLWDIGGQERFSNMTRVYYQGAHGAFVCFDRSRAGSLLGAVRWKSDIDGKAFVGGGEEVSIPCVLIATKSDLPNRCGETDEGIQATRLENRFVGCFQTSAKLGVNVRESAEFLTKAMLKEAGCTLRPKAVPSPPLRIDKPKPRPSKRSCC